MNEQRRYTAISQVEELAQKKRVGLDYEGGRVTLRPAQGEAVTFTWDRIDDIVETIVWLEKQPEEYAQWDALSADDSQPL